MRVLIVSDYSPTEVHGIALHVRNMVLEMAKLGHELQVYTCKSAEELEAEGYMELRHEAQIGNPDGIYRKMGLCITNYWNQGNQICLFPGWNLFQAMRTFEPDIVHIFLPSAVALAVLTRARFLGVPTYVSHHVDMVYYVNSYMPSGCFSAFADYSYSLSGRVPAALCGDANVAPSLAAMQKEFSFLDKRCFSSYTTTKLQPNDPRPPELFGDAESSERREAESDITSSAAPTTSSFGCFSFLSSLAASCGRSLAGNCIQKKMFRCMSSSQGPYSQRNYMVIPTAVPSRFSDGTRSPSTSKTTTASSSSPTEKRGRGGSSSPAQVSRTTTASSPSRGTTSSLVLRGNSRANGSPPKAGTKSTKQDSSGSKSPKPAFPAGIPWGGGLGKNSSSASSSTVNAGIKASGTNPNAIPKSPSKSSPSRAASSKQSGVKLRKILQIPNQRKILLMVNRLAPEKHVDTAIRVVSRFRDRFHLVICGDGPKRKELEELAVACYKSSPGAEKQESSLVQKTLEAASARIHKFVHGEDERPDGLAEWKKLTNGVVPVSTSSPKAKAASAGAGKILAASPAKNTKAASSGRESSSPLKGANPASPKRGASSTTSASISDINVTFCGAIPNDLLPELFYRESDFFLTCSESETFGITVIEALGCDLLPLLPLQSPVFAEFYEQVLGPSGCDVMFRDEPDLVRILNRLGTDNRVSVRNVRERLSARGSLFFSWQEAAEETVRQYEKVISKCAGRRTNARSS
ncbi:unnamed protein product [Amoebophrya sp. A120]|nr:unnamed protein product [Amoebophrya sp. A120]|eukprot:GSA120T00024051001.1